MSAVVQPSPYFEIEKYSHHFKLRNMSPSGFQLVQKFVRQYIQFGWKQVGRVRMRAALKTYAARCSRKNEVRLHIGQYKAFKNFLLDVGVPDVCYTEVEYGFVEAAPINCQITTEKTPRDYQEKINVYATDPLPSRRKFVGIDPGMGKTFSACWLAAQLNKRIVGFLKPKYLKKWPGDLVENLGMDEKDIVVVQGSAALMDVITRARNGTLHEKAILISNRTYQIFIDHYEEHGDGILDQGYDCLPEQFCQLIQAGLRIGDEVHEDFHCMFKIDLYCHVEWSISMSATLEDDDDFTETMYKLVYPPDERCKIVVRNKYVASYALRYRIKNGDQLRTTEFGSTNYSHMAFEKNFFGNRFGWLRKHYLELIDARFQERWLTRYEDGEKCLIFAASVDMCKTIQQYLKKKYPDLDIKHYVHGDPYDNLMKSQVCVSTIGSSGTGHDVKGLITVIMTNSIAKKAANIQTFGRLRKKEGVDMEFEYFNCMDIPKHMEYHHKKELWIAERAKSSTIIDLPYVVGEA